MAGEANDRRGRTAWIVIGALLFLGTFLATFVVFPNLKRSAAALSEKMRDLDERGKTLNAEECVEHVIGWYRECDVMASLCLQEVPKAVAHCLRAQDRAASCVAYTDLPPTSQWAYERCEAGGIDKTSEKNLKKACTSAWRALDQWCKTGQKGVIWGVK